MFQQETRLISLPGDYERQSYFIWDSAAANYELSGTPESCKISRDFPNISTFLEICSQIRGVTTRAGSLNKLTFLISSLVRTFHEAHRSLDGSAEGSTLGPREGCS